MSTSSPMIAKFDYDSIDVSQYGDRTIDPHNNYPRTITSGQSPPDNNPL